MLTWCNTVFFRPVWHFVMIWIFHDNMHAFFDRKSELHFPSENFAKLFLFKSSCILPLLCTAFLTYSSNSSYFSVAICTIRYDQSWPNTLLWCPWVANCYIFKIILPRTSVVCSFHLVTHFWHYHFNFSVHFLIFLQFPPSTIFLYPFLVHTTIEIFLYSNSRCPFDHSHKDP